MTFNEALDIELEGIKVFLIGKNVAYGNSVIEPVRIFSKTSAREQIMVRIDDKLSRIMRGTEYDNDDTIQDLIGYLLILRIQDRIESYQTMERIRNGKQI